MNSRSLLGLPLVIIMASISASCSEDGYFEGEAYSEPNSKLIIRTRALPDGSDGTDNSAKVSYPVYVYVFDSSGNCCKRVQVDDDASTVSIDLFEGTYSVYAVAGADAVNYSIPDESTAKPETEVSLNDGMEHGDLMSAGNTVSLVDGGENTLTLTLQRKVMLIRNISINNVPSTAKGVSVTLAPLYSSLRINGTYSGSGESKEIELKRDGSTKTWKSTDSCYLLPPTDDRATVTINIKGDNGAVKSYSYTSSQELAANYKISITGTYTERLGVSLSGTIVGATWQGEREITFDFDEDGSTETMEPVLPKDSLDGGEGETEPIVSDAPEVGTLYKDKYYVLSSESSDGITTVKLLTGDEMSSLSFDGEDQESAKTAIANAISEMTSESGISGWRLPSREEMDLINNDLGSINEVLSNTGFELLGSGRNYFVTDSGLIQSYVLNATGFLSPKIDGSTRLRAVTTLSFK